MAERQTGRHRRPPESQATYREVFAVGEFRALWLAQALSSIGDQLAQVALAVLVYERTSSPLLTALTYALTYIPPILGGPVLAGLADLFPRRRVMVICDLVRAGLVALMALQAMPFWMLCAFVFLTVLLGAPFGAARAAVLPDVLSGDRYVAGSAINNITHQATQMLGFLAGGAVVAFVGTREALALDSVTFAASAVILVAGLRRRPAPKRRERESLGLWKSTWDGGRLVFGDPTLRSLVLFAWLCAFYVIPEGLAAPYAATFDGDAVTVGVLMAAMPTGMAVGALVFSRCVRPTNRIRVMGWMAILACAPLIGAAAHPPLWVVVALWALSGVGSAYQLAAQAAFVAAVPSSGRGQAFGLAQSGIQAGQGLGILVAGAAAQVLGVEAVVAFAGALGVSVAAILTLSWNQVRVKVIASMYEQGTTGTGSDTPPGSGRGSGQGPGSGSEPEPGAGPEPGPRPEPSPGPWTGSPPDPGASEPEVAADVQAGVRRASPIVMFGQEADMDASQNGAVGTGTGDTDADGSQNGAVGTGTPDTDGDGATEGQDDTGTEAPSRALGGDGDVEDVQGADEEDEKRAEPPLNGVEGSPHGVRRSAPAP